MNDNKLIAEFMGWTPCDSNDNTMYANPQDKSDAWSPDEMRFNESWDWLMPVVIKCKESVDYCDDDNALEYHKIEDEMLSQLSIEDTYQAVVEFIKEYNDGCHQTYNDER